MTPTIVATPAADAAPAPRVIVEVDDLDPSVASVTIWRTSDRRQFRGRGAVRVAVAGGFSFIDFEAPFGIISSYRAQMFDAAGVDLGFTTSVDVTLECIESWIHNPLNPAGARQIDIADLDGARIERHVTGNVHKADTRTLGMLLSGHRRGATAALLLTTELLETAEAFEAMLGGYDDQDQTIPVLCVRSPRPYSRLPATFFAFCGDLGETPRTVHMGGQLIEWDGTFEEVAPPAPGLVVPLLTRDDLDAAFATRNAFSAAYLRRLDADRDYSKAGLAG